MRKTMKLAALGLMCAAGTAHATEYMWCVDSSGTAPVFDCVNGMTCATDGGGGNEFGSVAAALTAARSVGTTADAHHVCVWTPGTHTEDIVIDNSDGALGEAVDLWFTGQGADYCPATSGDAAITLTGVPGAEPMTAFGVNSMSADFAGCGAQPATLVSVLDGTATIQGARSLNFGGHLVQVLLGVETPSIKVFGSRFERFAGAMLVGSGGLSVDNSEISGFEPGVGVPLIEGAATTMFMNLTYSAFFGNVTRGAPLIQIPRGARLGQLTIAANVVVGYPSLVDWVVIPDGEVDVNGVTVSRNRFVQDGSVLAGPAVTSPGGYDPSTEWCLPGASDGSYFRDRPTLVTTGTTISGAAFALTAQLPSEGRARFSMVKSHIVDTASSGGAVLAVSGERGSLAVHLAHNTFAGGFTAVVDDTGTEGGAGINLARNLYGSAMPPVLSEGWAFASATLEAGNVDLSAWDAQLSAAASASIAGPFFPGVPEYAAKGVVDALTSCERLALNCPAFSGDCSGAGPSPGFLTQDCALDRASAWIPEASWADTLAHPWPWSSGALPSAEQETASTGRAPWASNATSP